MKKLPSYETVAASNDTGLLYELLLSPLVGVYDSCGSNKYSSCARKLSGQVFYRNGRQSQNMLLVVYKHISKLTIFCIQ